jgi:hypothetical protein
MVRMNVLTPAGEGDGAASGAPAGNGSTRNGAAGSGTTQNRGSGGRGETSLDRTRPAEAEAPVIAHWKTVEVAPGGTGIDAAGDCELVEQIKQKIMPLFTARNVDSNARCVPHQAQPIVPRIRADVLVTEQKEADASSRG